MEYKSTKMLGLTSLGALIGVALATWLAPKSIVWYFSPPVEFGVNCKDPIQWALHKLQIAQGIGLLIGALMGLMVFIIWWRRKGRETLTSPHDDTF